nr:ABC transporter ATP-binding protein [Tissierella sp.]
MELRLKGIKKSFDDKEVLKGVDFTFEQGKIYALLGRNGAGKTTLFNIMAEELKKEEGEVFLEKEGKIKKLESTDISYVYSDPILPEFLTGYEFIKFFMDINKEKIDESIRIEEYFETIKFDEIDRHKLIKTYSHGMKNKLQMLMFIIARPDIILLDEPLTSLDVVVALEIKRLLREIRSRHIIIFSTHILQLAKDLCDEIVVLHRGKLELVDKQLLGDQDFEDRIMDILKDEDNV